MICYLEEDFFVGAGGPHNLEEILQTFREWVISTKIMNR
ncbi:Imm53 family immunity protein [Vallitalea okinawensis]